MSDSKPSTPKPSASTSGPKPKPRAGIQRKSKAEREAFAREEAERQQARLAEAERNAAAAARGGRGGRAGRGGRGGASTPDRGREQPVGGNSVFGASTGMRPQTSRRDAPEGYSEKLEGQSTIKPDEIGVQGLEEGASSRGGGGGGGGGSGGGRAANRDQQYQYETISDDEAEEDRQPIETIILSSDQDDFEYDDSEDQADTDDDGDGDDKPVDSSRKGKQKEETNPALSKLELRPMMPRTNPDPERQKKVKAEKKSRGGGGGALKKQEPDTRDVDADDSAGDPMDIDEPVVVKEQPSSPEMRRRGLKKPGGRGREPKFANETIEERAERLRMMSDVRRLRRVFRRVRVKSEGPAVSVGEREDSKQTDQSDDPPEIETRRVPKGELFLFQLPPLTPFLVDSATADDEKQPEVKKEPGTDGQMTAPATANPTTTDGDEAKKDVTDGGGSGGGSSAQPKLQMDGTLTATEPTRLPAGLVGKLRLHKSGKVSLDWGGADMEVRYGSRVDFLQDVVMVESRRKNHDAGAGNDQPEGEADADASGDGGAGTSQEKVKREADDLDGTAYTLGHVRQKLVCIPDWARLYD
ncbi:hypothetical protein PV08_01636 [Exophiala spinifera]|uniref:DNA-directed RNA polymerase III subunit RPC4 n=1 Tax=Exophiala spinifera TaxID=91928 RepID=A0A0D2A8H0_9EURO|nr:uncharacterized protein PV08_01636 [Exophiala spinifera]KIW21057.1 hypothetical protein PV08_01636 [Exophiala spinifera]